MLDLIPAQGQVVLEVAQIVGPDDFALQWPRRLQIFEANALQIVARREPLDTIGVPLIRALVIPKPMLAAVGEDDEGSL